MMLGKLVCFIILFSFSSIFSGDRALGEPGKVYIVNASPVNLRNQPSTSGSKVGSLTKGQKVIFIEEKQNEEVVIDAIQAPWVKVKTEDGKQTGWMFGGFLVDNPGDTDLALGYYCLDFKKKSLTDFKGGCADKAAVGYVQGSGDCGIEFMENKDILFRLGSRTTVSGKWELQGNKIVGSITEDSKSSNCYAWDPNSEECVNEHMSKFGKKDTITLNYKVEFTPNPSKNTLTLKVNTAKDPKPLLLKRTFKSSIENKDISCLIPN